MTTSSVKAKYPLSVGGLPLFHQGKVRDTFAVVDSHLLGVCATDRLSTHNIVHVTKVPDKGAVLTALTVYWHLFALGPYPTHIVAYGSRIYDYLPKGLVYPEDLHRRMLIVAKLKMVPIEFIWRARMAGSLWRDYQQGRDLYGLGSRLRSGLRLMDKFEHPIFTPTDKSATDNPLEQAAVTAKYSAAVDLTGNAYTRMRGHLESRGIEMIDTKLEVGYDGAGDVVIADEFGTPDSSRFVTASEIQPGREPTWYDKEFFRKFAEGEWLVRKEKVPLVFPAEIVELGVLRYHELFERVTGQPLHAFQKQYLDS